MQKENHHRPQMSHSTEIERLVEATADGSNTLFIPGMNEHYHSVKGALTEAEHIFVNMGFQHSPTASPRILEIGFGTGLNAFLSLVAAEKFRRKTSYCGIELYPLPWETIQKLQYSINPSLHSIHSTSWEEEVQITPYFTLQKIQADFASSSFSFKQTIYPPFDVVYFDAFAPEKQPEMWDSQLFERLYVNMNKGAILTTYCAKGIVRRMLQSVGFIVERLEGPPGGKREILRAIKP